MSDRSIAKKGKNCVEVAKTVLNDIASGMEASVALEKLSGLQNDAIFLADTAKDLAERLDAVDKYYQQRDAEIKRDIEKLSRKEDEIQRRKYEIDSQLAAHRSVLQDNQDRLSYENSMLRDAERRLEEEEEKARNETVGSALLGLFTGGIGSFLLSLRREAQDARDAVRRRRDNLDRARSHVNDNQKQISIVESEIRGLMNQIEYLKQQCLQLHEEVGKIRSLIVFVKESVKFWSLFKDLSNHGVKRTDLLHKIISKATEKGDYRALQKDSTQRIASTFIEAWMKMETKAESGGPDHILEIEYRCSFCGMQYTALPYLIQSAFVCMNCHSRYSYLK